jgi:hypothetical protein
MDDHQSRREEFLLLCNDVLGTLRAVAEELELDDDVVFIAMAGLYDETTNRVEAIYDAQAPTDEVLITGLDFLDGMICQEIEDNKPEEGTIDWWINKLN